MGMITKTFSAYGETVYVYINDATSQNVSNSSHSVVCPSCQIKTNNPYGSPASSMGISFFLARNSTGKDLVDGNGDPFQIGGVNNSKIALTTYRSITLSSGESGLLDISQIFNTDNASDRTFVGALYVGPTNITGDSTTSGAWYENSHGGGAIEPSSRVKIATMNFVLNAPPTFNSTQVSFTNDYDGDAYVGLTTASVTISGSSAKYGGTVASSSLTIGNQTVTGTGNGTLSILLDTAGTFTPTVTVTDSRGQTTTKSLDPIEVKSYVAPEVSFTLERTNSSGTVDDEGTYAVASATFNWTDAIATLSQPTVTAVDSSPIAVSTTWYTDRALTTAVNWSSTSSWTSPKTLYGRIGALPVNESSQITITPNDSEGSGTPQTQTLASAFYTIDFLAGGHGIAFGQPASQTGLHCDMEATFNRTVDVGEEISSENVLLQLDTTATSGTDKEIYDALVSLGWDGDVIV